MESDSEAEPQWESPEAGLDGVEKAVAVLREDPVAALEVARGLPASDRRDEFLDQAVAEWGGRDAVAAACWVRQVQPPSLRNRLLGNLGLGMATEHPREAARLVANEMDPGAEQDRAVVSIVKRWTKSDPAAAAEWVGQFPMTPMQGIAVDTVVVGWHAMDPAGFMEWLQGLPEGRFKTRASVASRRLEIRFR